MAMKRPVIATDVGGNSELVIDGTTGFVVAKEDPDLLAKAILSIIKDPPKGTQMGEMGYARVNEYFSLTKMVAEYEGIYEELMESTNGVSS